MSREAQVRFCESAGVRFPRATHLPMISRVTANLKAWIKGTFHSVREHHLQAYLDEFMFRFNRRFSRAVSFQTLLGLGTLRVGPTYRELYGVTHRENRAKG